MLTPEIIAPQYRKTKEEISSMLNYIHNIDITPEIIVMIDYAYHNTDDNYENGLSFISRLHNKLSKYFEIDWDIENIKQAIVWSNEPTVTYIEVLKQLLTQEMIDWYGV